MRRERVASVILWHRREIQSEGSSGYAGKNARDLVPQPPIFDFQFF